MSERLVNVMAFIVSALSKLRGRSEDDRHELAERVALVRRGYICRRKGHARAIEVLRLPSGVVSPESLALENANQRAALLRARDALQVYEPRPATALSAVLGALRRGVGA